MAGVIKPLAPHSQEPACLVKVQGKLDASRSANYPNSAKAAIDLCETDRLTKVNRSLSEGRARLRALAGIRR
jgi:hypothetical protein